LEGENANRIGEDFKWRQVEVVGNLTAIKLYSSVYLLS